MPKKKFIEKKQAQHFHLVHRSLKDPLLHDTESSDRVLAQVQLPNQNNITAMTQEKEEIIKEALGEAAQHGIFFDDQNEYDYLQHLREIGQSQEAIWIPAPTPASRKEKKVTFKDEVDTEEVVELEGQGLITLDENVLQVMEALDNEAFECQAGEEAEDFFSSLIKETKASKNDEIDDDDSFDVGSQEEGSQDSFSDYEEAEGCSNFSMTSSAVYRNANLTQLDDHFDNILKEYSEEEDDDEEAEAEFEVKEKFNEIWNDFLMNEKLSKRSNASEQMDALREMLKDITIQNIEDEPEEETPTVSESEEEGNDWDCQTILTTYTNTENIPKVLKLPPMLQKQIKVSHKTGMPLGIHPKKQSNDSDDESEEEEEVKQMPGSRDRNESAEEKKKRKQQIKEEKREKRQEKKQTKLAFKQAAKKGHK